jgi:rRNA maturation RNase YbeY
MVSIFNKTKAALPKFSWGSIAEEILGKKFELNLVMVGEGKMTKLKAVYPPLHYSRGQAQDGKPTNVLSFLINENVGEIFICPQVARKEAKNFSRSTAEHFLALYIHGVLHLAGLDHNNARAAVKMAAVEEKILKKFSL